MVQSAYPLQIAGSESGDAPLNNNQFLACAKQDADIEKFLIENLHYSETEATEMRHQLLQLIAQQNQRQIPMLLLANGNPGMIKAILSCVDPPFRRMLVKGWFDYQIVMPIQSYTEDEEVKVLLESLTVDCRLEVLTDSYFGTGKLLNKFLYRWSHETVCVMLDSIETSDNRYEVLSYHDETGTPLHCAVDWTNVGNDTLRAMLESVSVEQRYQLLQIKGARCLSALHVAFFTRQHNMIQTMKNSLDAEKWLDLLMMPEPEHGDWSGSGNWSETTNTSY